MKTLIQHLNEKLIINKNYKNVDSIESLFDNIKFERLFKYTLSTSDDIFSIMVDYIRDYNLKRFSDFDSYKKIGVSDSNACLAVFNKSFEELYIFQKILSDTYYCFTIYTDYRDRYVFKRITNSFSEMNVLRNVKVWTNTDEVEYYEISKKTFEGISKLYDKLIKK